MAFIMTHWRRRNVINTTLYKSHVPAGMELYYRGDVSLILAAEQTHLIYCRLKRLSHTIYWKSPISILGTSGYEI